MPKYFNYASIQMPPALPPFPMPHGRQECRPAPMKSEVHEWMYDTAVCVTHIVLY